jgi:hypothetical protein
MFGRKQNDDLSTKNDDFTNDMKIVNAVIECYRYDRNHPQYLADCIQKTGIVELLNKHINYLKKYYLNDETINTELVNASRDELQPRIRNIIDLYNTPINTNAETYYPGVKGRFERTTNLTGMELLNELLVFSKTKNNGNYQNPEDKATLINFVKSMYTTEDLKNKPTLINLVIGIYKKKEDLKNKAMDINNYLSTGQTTSGTSGTAAKKASASTETDPVETSDTAPAADTLPPSGIEVTTETEETSPTSVAADPAASNNTVEPSPPPTPGGKRTSRRKKNSSRKSNNKKGGKSKSKKNHKKNKKTHKRR